MKRDKSVVLLRILQSINSSEHSLSISEISSRINSNWDTTNTNLKVLIKMGYIKKERDKYKLVKPYKKSKDSFFGIPIREKDKEMMESIFSILQKKWRKHSNKPLNRTRAHKYAVNIINNFNLKLPALWYKYGKVMLYAYDPRVRYEVVSDHSKIKEIDKYSERLILETKDKPSSYLKKLQYSHNRLYSSNTAFCKLLARTNFSAKHNMLLKDLLYKILFSLRKNEYNRKKIEMINTFAHLFIRLLKRNANSLKNIKSDITKIYDDVWNLIVLMNAYESLINYGYPREFLELYINFEDSIKLVDQSLCELKELAG